MQKSNCAYEQHYTNALTFLILYFSHLLLIRKCKAQFVPICAESAFDCSHSQSKNWIRLTARISKNYYMAKLQSVSNYSNSANTSNGITLKGSGSN